MARGTGNEGRARLMTRRRLGRQLWLNGTTRKAGHASRPYGTRACATSGGNRCAAAPACGLMHSQQWLLL